LPVQKNFQFDFYLQFLILDSDAAYYHVYSSIMDGTKLSSQTYLSLHNLTLDFMLRIPSDGEDDRS